MPESTVHATEELKLPDPETEALHWLVWPAGTVVGVHETLTDVIVDGAVIVTLAEPDLVESWVEVALMVSVPEAGTDIGAMYRPELEIVPETADQVTAEL